MDAPRAIAERIADALDPFRRAHFTDGNRVQLLASTPDYFTRLLAAIAAAHHSICVETYILADDATGNAVVAALAAAARRGVDVRLLVDGFGSGDFARRLALRLPQSGARLRIYRPERWWRPQRRLFRRLHRKIVTIDDTLAFVGGINVDDSPLRDERTGEPIGPRLDFAVQCEGPIVAAIVFAQRRLWWAVGAGHPQQPPERNPQERPAGIPQERPEGNPEETPEPPPRRIAAGAPLPGGVPAALVLRDNLRHRHAIERSYLGAIRAARRHVLLACAYFQPGRRFRRALVAAANRGVRVTLLLQGRVEYRLQHFAQRALYGQLLAAGIEIHEYRSSYLHAKVAVADSSWATVGSSNIDPLSLLLAREANVVVRDRAFSAELRACIEAAIRDGARPLRAADFARRSPLARAIDWAAYGLMRALTLLVARRDAG
jgi:cardiolipin synthase